MNEWLHVSAASCSHHQAKLINYKRKIYKKLREPSVRDLDLTVAVLIVCMLAGLDNILLKKMYIKVKFH
jgi:hypothetical protein